MISPSPSERARDGDALARTTYGTAFAAPGFDHQAHDRWVRAGHCPVVSVGRNWCYLPAGHSGKTHASPRQDPPPDFARPHWSDISEDRWQV